MSSSYRLVTNKKREYRCVDVCNWIQTTLFDIGELPIQAFITQYTSLMKNVCPEFGGITLSELIKLARRPHELLLCCFERDQLAASVQASLTFPAGQAVVSVRNLVIESSRRELGLGSLVVEMLEEACNEKWEEYRKLSFTATDTSGRNDDSQFTDIGYKVHPAVQYVRR